MKKKPPSPVATARILKNVKRVEEVVIRSPTCSAWQHAAELSNEQIGKGLSVTLSLRRANARSYRRTRGRDHHDE